MLSGVLSPRREYLLAWYFRSDENKSCSLDYFRPSDKFFAQVRGIFAQAKLVSPKLKKKKIFFFFWLFVSECLALWNAMYVFSKTN